MEIETGNITQGSGSEEQTRVSHGQISDDTESILELFEDRYGYDDDEFESEPVPVRRVHVYTVPASNTNQERALAVVTNPDGSAPSLAIREPLIQQQGNQQPVIQERRQVGADGELASISTESEATARYKNTYGFLEHRVAGQRTSANPNPPQPGLPLDGSRNFRPLQRIKHLWLIK